MMKMQRLSPVEKLDWLQLTRSENIGPRNFQMLVTRFGSAASALKALPELMRSGRMSHVIVAERDEVRRELDEIERQGLKLIALCEPEYPPALREIDSAPPLLTVGGNVECLQLPSVSIVGSRNASAAGLLLTERFARGLGEAGFCVTSGLARGIDAKAHRSALKATTVAVLAGGHNRIYPSEHTKLAAEICSQGALISEMPINWEPRGPDFPRRNRLVAGISLGTIVIEAALKSGSLITARLANEQGRQVFAVPGSPLDPRAEGTNNLLREGATFCTRIEDVIDALSPVISQSLLPRDLFREASEVFKHPQMDFERQDLQANGTQPAHETQQGSDAYPHAVSVQDLLGAAPISIDDLIRHSGVTAAEVQMALLELELSGKLLRHNNGCVSVM